MSSTSRQLARYAKHQVHINKNTQLQSRRETLDEYIPDVIFLKIAFMTAISLGVYYPIKMLEVVTMIGVQYYKFRVNDFDASNTRKLISDRKNFQEFQSLGAERHFFVKKSFIDTYAQLLPKLHELKPLLRNVQSIALAERCFSNELIEEVIKSIIGARYHITALDRVVMNCLKYYQFEVDAKDQADMVIFFTKHCDESPDDTGSDDDLSSSKGNYTFRHFMHDDKHVFAIKKCTIDTIAQCRGRKLFLDNFRAFVKHRTAKSGPMTISGDVEEKKTAEPLRMASV